MSTFYAIFRDPAKGKAVLRQLITSGVPEDDVSFIAGDHVGNGHVEAPLERMSDATSFVGRDDDPVIDNPDAGVPDREEKYYARESEVGGGISTGELIQDAAETVDQSLDPQADAEDQIEREDGVTQAQIELHDLDLAVETGFPTKLSGLDSFAASSTPPIDDFERSLEQISVPRLGLVCGGGGLATAALDFADDDPSDDESVVMSHLVDDGVPAELAKQYLEAVKDGGAVLAVGLIPGEVEPALVEGLADQFDGELAKTFDAPRF
jgi:hypothetical protein